MCPWRSAARTVFLAGLCAALVRAVPLNQIQVLGTHNSFHVAPSNELQAIRAVDDSGQLGFFLDSNQYTHPALDAQLEDFNVRSFEFDLYDDRPGGKFVDRPLRTILGLDDATDTSAEMRSEGFKCMHVDNIDYETHCKTLESCLGTIKAWSDSNPGHIPIILRLELKLATMIEELELRDQNAANTVISELQTAAESQPEIPTDLPRTDPPITSDTVSLLMDDVVSFLGADKLITPDDLRGNYNSLREALIDLGPEQFWPDVDDVRGKVLIIGGGFGSFLLELYGSSLSGSPAFTRYFLQPGSTSQALDIQSDQVFIEHFAAGTSVYLEPLMAEGFFVVGFSDLGGEQARANDFSTYDQVVKAGPNVIVTEYLQPGEFSGVQSQYKAELPCTDGSAAYCVLPSNFTGPVREAPVITSSEDAASTTLKDVPTDVEPRLPDGFEASLATVHVPALVLAVVVAVGVLALLQ